MRGGPSADVCTAKNAPARLRASRPPPQTRSTAAHPRTCEGENRAAGRKQFDNERVRAVGALAVAVAVARAAGSGSGSLGAGVERRKGACAAYMRHGMVSRVCEKTYGIPWSISVRVGVCLNLTNEPWSGASVFFLITVLPYLCNRGRASSARHAPDARTPLRRAGTASCRTRATASGAPSSSVPWGSPREEPPQGIILLIRSLVKAWWNAELIH